jgi:hypothetical protein
MYSADVAAASSVMQNSSAGMQRQLWLIACQPEVS